ncbi:MAG: hypothetical protein COA57_00620 [Flavobacteriales bacterium]|nr:MAG: hypothetical protein COA57_00620 [Flavobacteriales bacterium]
MLSSSAQIDSAIYMKFASDPSVIYTGYVKTLYKNAHTKGEGWMIKQLDDDFEQVMKDKGTDQVSVIVYKVGEWKEYYKNGKIKRKMYIPFEVGQKRTEMNYNRKGMPIYEFTFEQSEEFRGKVKKKWGKKKLQTFSKKWYKHGKVWHEGAFVDSKKDGSWNFYRKNETLKESIFYVDGKKTFIIKYDKAGKAINKMPSHSGQ